MISRSDVVNEALEWTGTPYVRKGRLKGKATDCGLFPYQVYRKFYLIPEFEAEWLSDDWFAHAKDERYLLMIERYLRRLIQTRAYGVVKEALPGSLVLAKVYGAKLFNHAGIVTKWPLVVHAIHPRVAEVDASQHPMWAMREIVLFDPFSVGEKSV